MAAIPSITGGSHGYVGKHACVHGMHRLTSSRDCRTILGSRSRGFLHRATRMHLVKLVPSSGGSLTTKFNEYAFMLTIKGFELT